MRWLLLLIASGLAASGNASDWPEYHGPLGRGAIENFSGPVRLADPGSVAWKVPLPGRGPSSPIVVGDRVIVTAASGPRQDRLHILAIDAANGKTLWHRQLWATGSTTCNPFGGVAAPTPASDGQRVVALFSSSDLACFNLEGDLLWYRGLGHERPRTRNDVGMASSPRIVGKTVVVQLENWDDSFAAGLDLATGVNRWQLPREKGSCWTSPMPWPGKRPVVLLQSRPRLTALDAETGKELWSHDANCHTVATGATWEHGVCLPADGLVALEILDGSDHPSVRWQQSALRLGNCSPVVHRDRVYAIKSAGVLACADLESGRTLWQLRLKGPFWSSPSIAGDLFYAVNQAGLVQAVKLGDQEGKLLGSVQTDKDVLASPAVSRGALFVRSSEVLWKIVDAR